MESRNAEHQHTLSGDARGRLDTEEVSRMSQEKPTKEIQCESCGNTFLGEATVSRLGSPPREWWPWSVHLRGEAQVRSGEGHQEYLVQARRKREVMAAAVVCLTV